MIRVRAVTLQTGTFQTRAAVLFGIAALALFGMSGCALNTSRDAVNSTISIELFNRSGAPVSGALMRFDRELKRVDRSSSNGFPDVDLRMSPADTLRLSGGTLHPGETAHYEVEGVGGPPQLVEGRWIDGDAAGREFERGEFTIDR